MHADERLDEARGVGDLARGVFDARARVEPLRLRAAHVDLLDVVLRRRHARDQDDRWDEAEGVHRRNRGVTVSPMSRQGDVAAAIASTLGVTAEIAARLTESAEIETIRARAEIVAAASGTVVARGAVKMVSSGLVIDVARAPLLVLAVPWKHVALRSCLVATLPEGALDAHPSALARVHAASAASLAARIDARAAPTVEARLDRLLGDLARRYGTRVSGGTFVALPLRGRDVASLVGTTTESVSRMFAAWKREGRIRATRDGIWLRA